MVADVKRAPARSSDADSQTTQALVDVGSARVRVRSDDDAAAADPLCVLELAGRFELTRSLGGGSSGEVFEALDRVSGQTVALKLLRHGDAGSLSRFKGEFRALAEIVHPNLIPMHELFVDARQRCFFTMELIQGPAFLDYVRPGPAGPDEARLRATFSQLALGVQHLHAHGLLHCDLKPSNVLIGANGRVSIVDFGLTQSWREAAPAGRAFQGTPAYAAPEQHDATRTSRASDWYAVGVMLYEALAGERPWPGNARELLKHKAQGVPAPPSQRAGAASSPALERICLQLLEPDPARRADGTALLAALACESARAVLAEAGPEREEDWPFVGRLDEYLQLSAAFECSLSGLPSGVVLSGGSGIGKTALAQHFLQSLDARRDVLVLRARCFVQEALPLNALDGLIDALANHLQTLGGSELAALVPDGSALLARVFPVLRRALTVALTGAGAAVLDPRDLRVLAFSALRELLQRLAARKPVVLFVDDLHWADRDSARWLQELLTPPLRAVWFLGTFRSDCDSQLLDEQRLAAQLTWLELGPLSEASVESLAERAMCATSAGRLSAIARCSGGHPLFARELIRYAAAHPAEDLNGQLALDTALQSRLSLLSDAARSVLELVCVAGQRVPRALVFDAAIGASFTTLRELRLASALRESVFDSEVHLEPYHDVVRQVVASAIDDRRQRALHGLVAELMCPLGDSYLERVVQHYMLAGQGGSAAKLAERAARHAASQLAFHSAASLYELALEHATDPVEQQRLRIAAAAACNRAGRTLSAANLYERAALAFDASRETLGRAALHASAAAADDGDLTDPTLFVPGELRMRAFTAYCVSGRATEARALLSQLASELGVRLDSSPMPLWRTLSTLGLLLMAGAPKLRSARHAGASDALRLLWRAAPSLLVPDPQLSCALVARALWLAARSGEHTVYAQALSFELMLYTLMFGRKSARVARGFERAYALVGQDGDAWEQAFVRVMHAGAELLSGDAPRATELVLEVASSDDLSSPFAAVVRTSARYVAFPALYNSGRVAQLAELAELWIKDAVDCGDRHMEVAGRVLSAHRHLRVDDPARALAEIERAERIELDYLHPSLTDPWWKASVFLYRGEPERALAVCERMRENYDFYAAQADPIRVEWYAIEGICAAALAARGRERERMSRLLRRSTWGAARAISYAAQPTAAQLRACRHLLDGRAEPAVAELHVALAHYERLRQRLRAASLRLSLAELEPRRRAEHEELALQVFAEEGIVRPDRWAYMLAPGLALDPDGGGEAT